MNDAPLTDWLRLDADVRRAWERLAREDLGTEEGRELAARRDPFADVRHVAGQSTHRALVEREPAAHEVLHRDALLRWVHELLQARIGRDLVIEDAKRVHTATEDTTKPRRGRAALSIDASTSTPEGERKEAGADSFAASWRGVLRAPDPMRAGAALERAASLASGVAAVRKERRARRAEAARRLGLAHPSALVASLVVPEGASDPSGASLARTLLDATEPLADATLRTWKKRAGGPWSPVDAMHVGLAREAREGWPARLGERWLEDVFEVLVVRPVRGVRFPEPLGGASFLRAAYAYGYALREQGTARSLPFALARDPYATGAHRFGAMLALALADPVLQTKRLGVSRRTATEQARILRLSLFLGLRELAARVLLAAGETDAALFEEVTLRVLGAPLPAALRDAWPDVRVDDLARLGAACQAHAFVADLVNRFDEDWFANPKAASHLASIACGPIAEPIVVDPASIAKLARDCEEALG